MRRWIAAAAVLIALAVAGPGLRWIGDRTGAASSSGWTALSFADPELADGGLRPGTPTSVPFTVENHEGSFHTYSWTAAMLIDGGSIPLADGTIELADEGSIDLLVEVPAQLAITGTKLEVALHTGQRIDLRVGES